MGNINGTSQNHRTLCMLANHSRCIHILSVIQGSRIELCTKKQNIIPVRHGHLCTHGAANGTSRHCHLMNLCHIPAGSILPCRCRIIGQGCNGIRYLILRIALFPGFSRPLWLYQFKIGYILPAERTGRNFRNRLSFLLFIVNCPTYSAFVNRHKNTPIVISK